MTITELSTMARRIHDVERWNLGASSTRERRNAFIEFVVGCAHWGHPLYNLFPDKRWNCKDPDGQGGRPMSDDIAVFMPERIAFDLILGAGGDGYSFPSVPESFYLPADQWVFAPTNPNKSVEPSQPAPQPATAPLSQDEAMTALRELNAFYASAEGLQRPGGMVIDGRADLDAMGQWFYQLVVKRVAMPNVFAQIRGSDEWKAKH